MDEAQDLPYRPVDLEENKVTLDGVTVSYGELVGQFAYDGLQFIYLANANQPDVPLIAMPSAEAIGAIRSIAKTLQQIVSNRDEFNQLVQDRLSRVQECIQDIMDYSPDQSANEDE